MSFEGRSTRGEVADPTWLEDARTMPLSLVDSDRLTESQKGRLQSFLSLYSPQRRLNPIHPYEIYPPEQPDMYFVAGSSDEPQAVAALRDVTDPTSPSEVFRFTSPNDYIKAVIAKKEHNQDLVRVHLCEFGLDVKIDQEGNQAIFFQELFKALRDRYPKKQIFLFLEADYTTEKLMESFFLQPLEAIGGTSRVSIQDSKSREHITPLALPLDWIDPRILEPNPTRLTLGFKHYRYALPKEFGGIEPNYRQPREGLIPVAQTDIFNDYPGATFWLGVVAAKSEIIHPREVTTSGVLRANVYINEFGYLQPEARQEDGTESDDDDPLSVRFAALERYRGNLARTVGVIRLIIKDKERPLPVERFFPEAFSLPLPTGSAEASRFVARHETKAVQRDIATGLIRALISRAYDEGSDFYAIVEEPLFVHLRRIGLPCTQIAEPKEIPEYGNTVNTGLLFKPAEVMRVIQEDVSAERLITNYFRRNNNRGCGYFGPTFLDNIL